MIRCSQNVRFNPFFANIARSHKINIGKHTPLLSHSSILLNIERPFYFYTIMTFIWGHTLQQCVITTRLMNNSVHRPLISINGNKGLLNSLNKTTIVINDDPQSYYIIDCTEEEEEEEEKRVTTKKRKFQEDSDSDYSPTTQSNKKQKIERDELYRESDDESCIICLERKRKCAARPCNHLRFCNTCCIDLQSKSKGKPLCPVCRKEVDYFESFY